MKIAVLIVDEGRQGTLLRLRSVAQQAGHQLCKENADYVFVMADKNVMLVEQISQAAKMTLQPRRVIVLIPWRTSDYVSEHWVEIAEKTGKVHGIFSEPLFNSELKKLLSKI